MVERSQTEITYDLRWYLVQYKQNAAQIAVRNLENQSFGTFLPLQEITKRKGKIFQQQILPLFPGYLFVQIDPDQGPWRQVNNTRGVARLIRLGAEPSVVPNEIVQTLIARCDKNSVLRQTSKTQSTQFHAGNQAKVIQGPFSGFIAAISDIKPDNRINILIEIMGHKTKVTINAGALQPVG
jgi:transcriptional antiterminator RfaH